jgi:starch synthase
MTVVVSHPTGNSNVRAVLRATARAKILDTFWTSFALPPAAARIIPGGHRLAREMGRRIFEEAEWSKVRVRPQREALRIAARRLGFGALVRQGTHIASVDAVYQHLDRSVADYLLRHASSAVSTVYAYEDGAAETFRAAAKTGRRRVYDLPIAHWKTLHRVLAEESDANPEWSKTIDGLRDQPDKLARKDEELETADLIVVASSFTRASVQDHFGTARPVILAPYGAPRPYQLSPTERKKSEPLKLVYAGHLDQRKGISYLIDSLSRLAIPWEITLAGSIPAGAPPALIAFLQRGNVRYLGHVPHQTLLENMARGHAFVFPSLIEGFGLVLTEAMAAGMPIITTPHTAGPDLIRDGVEGYIVPIRDSESIAAHLTNLYDDEPKRCEMSAAALAAAALRPWRMYENAITAVLQAY